MGCLPPINCRISSTVLTLVRQGKSSSLTRSSFGSVSINPSRESRCVRKVSDFCGDLPALERHQLMEQNPSLERAETLGILNMWSEVENLLHISQKDRTDRTVGNLYNMRKHQRKHPGYTFRHRFRNLVPQFFSEFNPYWLYSQLLHPQPLYLLVGGFKHFLFFHNIWDNPSHWLIYLSRWLYKLSTSLDAVRIGSVISQQKTHVSSVHRTSKPPTMNCYFWPWMDCWMIIQNGLPFSNGW